MRRPFLTLSAAVIGISACDAGPSLPPISAADHAAQRDKWAAERLKIITTPGRAPSYTGLRWLHQGPNTVGGDASNDVVLAGTGVPKRVGVLVRDGFTVRFEPDPSAAKAGVLVDSQPPVALQVRTDADTGANTRIFAGSAGFRVVRRVDSIGVRSWDAKHAMLEHFPGLQYYPIDPAWRVAGRLNPLQTPQKIAVMTESGVPEEHEIVGTVMAKMADSIYHLIAFAGTRKDDLFITFSDQSSGDETYGFRFIHAALDTVTNLVTLDFNYAYNPECAFSAFTTCPLPPVENRINAKVLAGEKKFVKAVDR